MKAVILPELSHYRVTEDGRVISELGNELSQTTDRDGYLRVALNHRQWRSKKIPRRVRAYVHILVAGAFHGPCPEGMQVRHLDHDKSNNHKDNLAYGTPSENAQDRVRAGNHGSRAGAHKYKWPVQRDDGVVFESVSAAARDIGCSPTSVSRVLRGERATCHGYKFKYLPAPSNSGS